MGVTELAGLAPAREIVRMRAGSHLYGTSTPSSDLDLKAVVLPGARDILLQRAKPTTTESRPRTWGERNGPDDVDVEAHGLQRYLDLLCAGQPVAVEMLFAPETAFTAPPDPLWREVQSLGPRLVTRRVGVFLRYCRRQADLHGAKGARVAAARRAAAVLAAAETRHGAQARLEQATDLLDALAAEVPHVALADVEVQPGRVVRHLDLCGRKTPYTTTIRAAREAAERAVARYGRRAKATERCDGVDWKALSHAVRVGREAVELLSTGRLPSRWPRPGTCWRSSSGGCHVTRSKRKSRRCATRWSERPSARPCPTSRTVRRPKRWCCARTGGRCSGRHTGRAHERGRRRARAHRRRATRGGASRGRARLARRRGRQSRPGLPVARQRWDVRFLHVRPFAASLGAVPPRDGIECPIADGLDLGGWDPRKALGLLVRSNAAALEWLSFPIVHRRDEEVAAELAGLARIAAHRPALEHHGAI